MIQRISWLVCLITLFAACRNGSDSVASAFEGLQPPVSQDWPFRHSDLNIPVIAAKSATINDRGMPPNTLPSIMHLADEGGFWIETHIQITADGEFILYGDAPLEETSNGFGSAPEHTLDELQALLLKDEKGILTTYHISTLKEVLHWNAVKGGQLLWLDPQANVPLDSLVKMIENSKHLKSVIIGVDNPKEAVQIWNLNPEVFISVPLRGISGPHIVVDRARYSLAMTSDVENIADPVSLIESLHESDIAVIYDAGGVTDGQDGSKDGDMYDKILELNPDIYLTYKPLYLRDYLKNLNSE